MDSRRNFIGKVASGLGTLAAVPGRVLGANDRIRVGFIGFGDRGMELLNHVRACSNAEPAAICDIFTRQREKAGNLAVPDYRHILDDKSIDAVVIATPQHLHAEHFRAAMDAGKHIYLERTLAFTVEQARGMRAAFRKDGGRHTVQIGHQACSFGHMADVRQFLSDPERMGRITAIDMRAFRNTPHGKPQWSRSSRITSDVNPDNVEWKAFLGEAFMGGAAETEFDANRYMNWRLYWDYSGGGVYENMSHQLSFWYKALDLQIPRAVTMNGGVYLWKDGREVPDTMHVSMEQPEEILITWTSGFGNNQLGVSEDVLGDRGTISRDNYVRYIPQKMNRPEGTELAGRTTHVPHAHMQNFFDSIRSGTQPNCPLELGYRVAIASRMAVDSYRLGRTLRWDPQTEEIV